MQIIKPCHNKIATKVKSWRSIKKEAFELREFINAKGFKGNWDDAFAISHTQVSEEPKRFFVLNEIKIKRWGHWCIINLKIIKKSVPSIFPEG